MNPVVMRKSFWYTGINSIFVTLFGYAMVVCTNDLGAKAFGGLLLVMAGCLWTQLGIYAVAIEEMELRDWAKQRQAIMKNIRRDNKLLENSLLTGALARKTVIAQKVVDDDMMRLHKKHEHGEEDE